MFVPPICQPTLMENSELRFRGLTQLGYRHGDKPDMWTCVGQEELICLLPLLELPQLGEDSWRSQEPVVTAPLSSWRLPRLIWATWLFSNETAFLTESKEPTTESEGRHHHPSRCSTADIILNRLNIVQLWLSMTLHGSHPVLNVNSNLCPGYGQWHNFTSIHNHSGFEMKWSRGVWSVAILQ